MPNNYVLLEKITVGAAGAASVTFANIPQTGYTDLVLAYSMRTNRSTVNAYPAVQFNGSASNLSQRELFGNGSGAFSASGAIIQPYAAGNGATSNTFGNGSIYIPNYTSSSFKSVSVDAVGENNGTEAHAQLMAGLWSNTAAITSVAILAGDGSTAILANSTFYLYGVAKLGTTPAIAPKASGGDIIDTDGTYWYHTFLSSGTFTPAANLTTDYLVVAGGGGGQASNANGLGMGGGGAGGLRSTVGATGGGGSLESPLALASNTSYTVTIGAGGAGGTANTSGGTAIAGSNSVFSTITSIGGGRGANQNGPATSGGSGGGDCGDAAGLNPGAGTSGQGFAGGQGGAASNCGAGGGGAGAVGQAGDAAGTGRAGAGGAGVATSISGTSITYAGGGGGSANADSSGTPTGGAGGAGGGGVGTANATNGTAGTANRGGGGGAGGATGSGFGQGGNGGSGIVIIRYAVA